MFYWNRIVIAWTMAITFIAAVTFHDGMAQAKENAITLNRLSTHATGIFGKSAAEIPSFCPQTRRLFIVNAASGTVNVLAVSNDGQLKSIGNIDAAADMNGSMGAANSVSISQGVLAVAIDADPITAPGMIALYHTESLQLLGAVTVGSLPDMVTFSPDGRWLLVANEGEPNEDYTIDPEGSVSIIDLEQGFANMVVQTADFREWNVGGSRAAEVPGLRERGLRTFGRVTVTTAPYTGRESSFAEDVEPEWIEVAPDSRTAYVCLQENNAIAEIDIMAAKVSRIIPLGFKDHGQSGNEIDVSDRDDAVRIKRWKGLYGTYQPDTIRLYVNGGRRFLVTANEGDSRARPYDHDAVAGVKEGGFFSDEATINDWPLKGSPFESLAADSELGRLKLVRDLVDRHRDADGRPTKLFSFGARSFSIFDADSGDMVFDSGSDFERITAARYPRMFNTSNLKLKFDDRSRAKGPEPEGIALGQIASQTYAFIGLERIGGIMIYNITNPQSAAFVGYHNHRNFDVSPTLPDGSSNPQAGDSGIEGLIFITAEQSPTGTPLLVTANETSGTTTVWQIESTPISP